MLEMHRIDVAEPGKSDEGTENADKIIGATVTTSNSFNVKKVMATYKRLHRTLKSWPAVTEVQFRRVVTQTVRSSIVRPETRRDFVAGAVHPRRYPTLLWSRGFAGADHMTPRPVLQNSATTAALLSTV
ncbi:uncharacterized protein LOC111249309 isoform X2 [Varroa destructor]|uniref:Uncharacterized protein n=1 Tax=Varroa destructor TaxID=109461 RepID=A0A7M7JY26_VARDE|nr:uncharacterized protein LOC111249309 isoform X2 [Varroa destructor]